MRGLYFFMPEAGKPRTNAMGMGSGKGALAETAVMKRNTAEECGKHRR